MPDSKPLHLPAGSKRSDGGLPTHGFDPITAALANEIFAYARERIEMDPPLDGPLTYAELAARAGDTITAEGLGEHEALRVFAEVLAPATISSDHPRYFAFVPQAPTEAAILFDLVVGASCIFGGSWMEGAGAIYAENQALRWLADLAGLPADAGGCFVSGGTAGNLSALVAARHSARSRIATPVRPKLAVSTEAHSSIAAAANVMDVEIVQIPGDEQGRLTGANLERVLGEENPPGLFAVVATAGLTNTGLIDDLAGVAEVCARRSLWFHVDAAYGGAGLAAPSIRARYAGIERADSLVIDPHKWLFAPFDCAALVYRDPTQARDAHTQHAPYLDALRHDDEWNPSDFAFHLTRRARGLPFWFSLAALGTDAYAESIETTLTLTRQAAELVRQSPHLELVMYPELSVLLIRRLGWVADDFQLWSQRLLASGTAFVVPTTHQGETVARLCIVNPRTTTADVNAVLQSMA